MTLVTAQLSDYRQSPRKVRLLADAVRGKKASVALTNLSFVPKRASAAFIKLLKSAIANAKNNHDLALETLVVKEVSVNGGAILYRRMPRARGSAAPIRKRTSHVKIVLESRTEEPKKKSKSKKNA
jgi:large subunit ribosomal protein L22